MKTKKSTEKQTAFPIDISLRMAIDTGRVKFFSDTGKIVSEVINYDLIIIEQSNRLLHVLTREASSFSYKED